MGRTAQPEQAKPTTRALHVPLPLHKQVAEIALKQDITRAKASELVVKAGLAALGTSRPA